MIKLEEKQKEELYIFEDQGSDDLYAVLASSRKEAWSKFFDFLKTKDWLDEYDDLSFEIREIKKFYELPSEENPVVEWFEE